MRASILTIGTEITSGEIVNSNAAWIAQQLESQGHTVTDHLTVRDERADMIEALDYLSDSEILIVTGGLGPTSDDLTREILAEWAGTTCDFSEPVWTELNAVYGARGLALREAHKHQCYFPATSHILPNPVGTAQGFTMTVGHARIFVLPGPPRELEGMWPEVRRQLPEGNAFKWTHWTCLGLPESEVAELVEPLIAGLGIEVGYRASVPYVYLKLRGEKFDTSRSEKVDRALGAAVVSRGKIDLATTLAQKLAGQDIIFEDEVTRGILSARLHAAARANSKFKVNLIDAPDVRALTSSQLVVAQILRGTEPTQFEVVLRRNGETVKMEKTLPFKTVLDSERGAKSATEWAIFQWVKWL